LKGNKNNNSIRFTFSRSTCDCTNTAENISAILKLIMKDPNAFLVSKLLKILKIKNMFPKN